MTIYSNICTIYHILFDCFHCLLVWFNYFMCLLHQHILTFITVTISWTRLVSLVHYVKLILFLSLLAQPVTIFVYGPVVYGPLIWPSVPWTICYMLKYHYRVARVQVFVNSIISPGDILLHSKILLYTSARFIGMLSFLQRGRIERWQGRSQKCVWIYNAINKCKFLSSNIILWSETNFVAMQINI